MCLELSLTELCQFPDVLYSQDVCDSSAKLASQITATAEKQRESENTNEDHVTTMTTLIAAAVST